MQPLKLLKIDCDIPGIVRINGDFVGQTPAPDLCRYVADGRICLEYIPLCQPTGGQYLPIARMLDLRGDIPTITQDDGVLRLYLLPDNAYAVHIHPPVLPMACIPNGLASLHFQLGNTQYLAEIYQDRGICFALCDATGNTLIACIFSETELHDPRLFVRRIQGRTYLFAEGQMDGHTRLLCADVTTRKLCFIDSCLRHQITDTAVSLYLPCGCAQYCMRCTYTDLLSGHTPAYRLEQQQPPDGQALSIALVQTVRFGDTQSALQLLTPSLREQLSFSDLQEFLGDVQDIYPPLCSETQIAAVSTISSNIYRIRLFCFEISQGKIANLTEQ